MTAKANNVLFAQIDELIETSDPLRAEYFRGFRQGIHLHLFGPSEKTNNEHSEILDFLDWSLGDPYRNAFARGYRDGCNGTTPEDID